MSNARDGTLPASIARESISASVLYGPVAALGFWTAIALPFLYLPLLLVGPGGGPERTIAFALIALHAVALFLGHNHRRDD
jgi:hypothetical protein